jgi:hypothetical protein
LAQHAFAQIALHHGRVGQHGAAETGSPEVGPRQVGAVQRGHAEVGGEEIGRDQLRPLERRLAQLGAGEVDIAQVAIVEVEVREVVEGQLSTLAATAAGEESIVGLQQLIELVLLEALEFDAALIVLAGHSNLPHHRPAG